MSIPSSSLYVCLVWVCVSTSRTGALLTGGVGTFIDRLWRRQMVYEKREKKRIERDEEERTEKAKARRAGLPGWRARRRGLRGARRDL
mmetsp:Transcript_31021/g.90136  ORF Transcript_31021/g.90136 Transcript_31021/m.90136 type:complete len:88 (-) Transcript_31021:96-359(-)